MRAIIGRIAAAIVAFLVIWIAGTLGVEVTEQTAATFTEAVTLLGMGLFTLVYAMVHKIINARINPTDAASPAAVKEAALTPPTFPAGR